jgi:hypothetical protein
VLLAAPREAFSQPFVDRIMPLKEELGARHLSLEILKTGRRIWVTVFMDPVQNTLQMEAFMELKARVQAIARDIHPNAQTEVILERSLKSG